ncbi:MAG: N-acetyltransferase [Clostridiales bacterium]|nr:N-acetyltransferase [Clostridiales bacterium]
MNIRLETPKDYSAVERLTFAAFETMTLPGRTHTDEHYLAHILRGAPAFIPELDYVLEEGGRILANIMYSKSKVVRPNGDELETITFGPVSVSPEFHCRGLGTKIIGYSLDRARELGFGAVIIVGHPLYYPRFGFKAASEFNLVMSNGSSFDAFMALELREGFLGFEGGEWYEDSLFEIDQSAFNEWHKGFLREAKA